MVFMGAYLGAPGSMRMFARLKGSSSESAVRATSYKTTLGGRLRAQVSPQVLREWSCSLPVATPEESQHLKALTAGVFGLGPFAWVPVQATTTNVMTLGASMPGPTHRSWSGSGDPTGVWDVPGLGVVRHSVLTGRGTCTFGRGTPVVPGMPVTGGAWVAGDASTRVTLQLIDAAGAIVASAQSPAVHSITPTRSLATILSVPQSAVTARIVVNGALQVGLPSISWSAEAADWAPGGGSTQVVIEGFDAGLVHVDTHQGLMEDISFTVKELTSDA